MDKRIALGRNKYKHVHIALFEEGYETTFLENPSKRSELTSKFIDELRNTLN